MLESNEVQAVTFIGKTNLPNLACHFVLPFYFASRLGTCKIITIIPNFMISFMQQSGTQSLMNLRDQFLIMHSVQILSIYFKFQVLVDKSFERKNYW